MGRAGGPKTDWRKIVQSYRVAEFHRETEVCVSPGAPAGEGEKKATPTLFLGSEARSTVPLLNSKTQASGGGSCDN